MRISQLSARTGVPTPTIKFYLRDGLIPKGEATGRNQAEYGEEHVAALNMIRALTSLCGLPLDTARTILASIHQQHVSPALSAIALQAPSVEAVLGAAKDAGVAFGDETLGVFRAAAENLEQAESGVLAGADTSTIIMMSALGDALIVAMRNQIRMEAMQ